MADALGLIELDENVEVNASVQPVFVIDVPKPQTNLGDKYIGESAQVAVAAQFGATGIVNPLDSGVIVRPERVMMSFTDETNGFEIHTSSDTTFGVETVLLPGATDFQNPGRGAARLRVGTDATFNNLPGFKKGFLAVGVMSVGPIREAWLDLSDFVLTPGTSLWLASLTVNTITFYTWRWTEQGRDKSRRQ